MSLQPYNPLDKKNLARSIEAALLDRPAILLSDAKRMAGAGVYALYYSGRFDAYEGIQAAPINASSVPIYVGKAIPEGGRIGGLGNDAASGRSLSKRLGDHRRSISQSSNLEVADFWVRYLLVDAIWIPLGENVLIERFRPVWNGAIFGFGNNAPGKGRLKQVRSPWDALHPGRRAFRKLPLGELTEEFLLKRARDHIGGRPLDPLPSSVVALLDAAETEVENAANEAGSEIVGS